MVLILQLLGNMLLKLKVTEFTKILLRMIVFQKAIISVVPHTTL